MHLPDPVWQWPTVQPFRKKIFNLNFFRRCIQTEHRRQKGTVEVPAEAPSCSTAGHHSVVGMVINSTPVASDPSHDHWEGWSLQKRVQPRIGIWLKGKKGMLYAQPRHALTRCDPVWNAFSKHTDGSMHWMDSKSDSGNWWGRIFTTKLVMEK
jgi:hypothetical protein